MLYKEIYIVAGGPSLAGFDFSKLANKTVMVVNKSIVDIPKANIFITMDYTFIDYIDRKTDNKLTRASFKRLPCIKYFVVATNNQYIRLVNGNYVDIRSNYQYILKDFNQVIASNSAYGIGGNFYQFVHGCNSGYCAIQLALILGYKKIHLLGFDLQIDTETHYHHGYKQNKLQFEKKLDMYYNYYVVGLHNIKLKFPNVKMISYSKEGRLNKFIEYKPLGEIK